MSVIKWDTTLEIVQKLLVLHVVKKVTQVKIVLIVEVIETVTNIGRIVEGIVVEVAGIAKVPLEVTIEGTVEVLPKL